MESMKQEKPENKGKQASKSPIQFFPTTEEMEAIDAIAFRLIASRGDGRIGRTTIARLFVSAVLHDKTLLLRTVPELKHDTPTAVVKLLQDEPG